MNNPEVTEQALSILRSGQLFQWYVITLLALVVYVYANENSKKNWRGVAAGLALYAVHWFTDHQCLDQHFRGMPCGLCPPGQHFCS
jgi:hypothetical protein